MIIACNNREFLTQVLARIEAPSSTQAFPSELPEWKQVDRSKPLWGLRRFRPERANEDPSYPGNGLFPGDEIAGPIGVVLDIDGPSGSITARFISGSKTNPWMGLSEAGDFEGQAKTKQLSSAVWELSASANKEVGTFAVFAIMAVLGFVVLV